MTNTNTKKVWDMQEQLKIGIVEGHNFRYDPNTGNLWKLHKKKSIGWYLCSTSASSPYYRQVKINGKQINQHRIIYKLMTGTWPEMVDHINGDILDNTWKNLRETVNRDNQLNQQKHREGHLPGTYFKTTKYWQGWISQVSIDGEKIHLGTFKTQEAAHNAYIQARENYDV